MGDCQKLLLSADANQLTHPKFDSDSDWRTMEGLAALQGYLYTS
jgi:hypothetical protein